MIPVKKLTILVAVLAAILMAPAASADSVTIGGSGLPCASCNGVVITLDVNASGPGVYTVVLTMDVSGITDPDVTGVGTVEFKLMDLTSNATLIDFSIDGGSAGTAGWFVTFGPNSANACGGISSTGKICTQDNSGFLGNGQNPLAPVDGNNGIFVWTWTVEGTFQGLDAGWHIGALFGHSATQGCGNSPSPCFMQDFLISEEPVSVPEPGTLALLGAALLGLAGLKRRAL